MQNLNIIKFACLSFTTLEYFVSAEKELVELNEASIRSKFDWDSMNRQQRNKAEKVIATHLKELKKNMSEWKHMLQRLADSFINDPQHEYVYDSSIDLIHKALDKFEVSNEVIEKDLFKEYMFDKFDEIKPRKRSEEDLTKLKASFNNFLTIHKLR